MATNSGRVAMLTTRHPLNYFLLNQLAAQFEVALVIYEQTGLRRAARQIWRRARRLGWPTVLGQLLYLLWDRAVVRPRSQATITQLLAGPNLQPPPLPQLETDSVNSVAAVRALTEAAPAVCVVSGTTILRPEILKLAPCFLNIHAGLTPAYRGAHGAFWAICEGHPELAGVTIHLVEPGIDTGAIVAQTTIALDPLSDTPRTLVAKQYLAGAPLMVEAARRALAGTLETYRRDDLPSRLWYSPTPGDYLRFRQQLAKLKP